MARDGFTEDLGGHRERSGLRAAGRGKGFQEGRACSNSAFRNVTPGGRGEPRALTCDTVRHSRGVACAATPRVRRESRWKWTFFCT